MAFPYFSSNEFWSWEIPQARLSTCFLPSQSRETLLRPAEPSSLFEEGGDYYLVWFSTHRTKYLTPFSLFNMLFLIPCPWNRVPNRSARLKSQCSTLTEVTFTRNICLNYEMPIVKTIDIFNHCIPEQMREIFQSSYQSLIGIILLVIW